MLDSGFAIADIPNVNIKEQVDDGINAEMHEVVMKLSQEAEYEVSTRAPKQKREI